MAKTTKPSVEEIIQKTVFATRLAAERETKDTFKATEARLYAYPILKLRIKDKQEELVEIQNIGVRKKSKSIVRYQKSGVRLSEEEITEAIVKDIEAQIAGDEKECETIEKAVSLLGGDPYQDLIKYKYFQSKRDDEIGEILHCDARTVRNHKSRLVNRISVFLYGSIGA